MKEFKFTKEMIEHGTKVFKELYTKEEVLNALDGYYGDDLDLNDYRDVCELVGECDSLYDLEQNSVGDVLSDIAIKFGFNDELDELMDDDYDEFMELIYFVRDEIGLDVLGDVFNELKNK